MGALVSPYSHSSSTSGLPNDFINYALSKPNMWNTTPLELKDWWLTRQQAETTQRFETSNGLNNLTLTVNNSQSPNIALDVVLPLNASEISNLQILLNGEPSTNYRLTNNDLKIQAGQSSTVTILYQTPTTGSTAGSWVQSSLSDFESGTLSGLDAVTVPGQLTLAGQSVSQPTVLFTDTFNNSSYTTGLWSIRSGSWTVDNDYYNMVGSSDAVALTYTGNVSWTNT